MPLTTYSEKHFDILNITGTSALYLRQSIHTEKHQKICLARLAHLATVVNSLPVYVSIGCMLSW